MLKVRCNEGRTTDGVRNGATRIAQEIRAFVDLRKKDEEKADRLVHEQKDGVQTVKAEKEKKIKDKELESISMVSIVFSMVSTSRLCRTSIWVCL